MVEIFSNDGTNVLVVYRYDLKLGSVNNDLIALTPVTDSVDRNPTEEPMLAGEITFVK